MPTDSLFPRVEVPKVDLWTFLFENKNRKYPDDKVIYIDADTGRSYTYATVKSTAIDFGKGLKATWDWQKGDVLTLFTPNSIDIGPVTWGTHWAGGVVSPANPGYTIDELAFQLQDSDAKALVTQAPLLSVAKEAAKKAGLPQDRIILMGDQRDPEARIKHFTSIRNTSGATRYRRTKVDPEDLVFLVYSSGTTGLPKGVMLCHRNIVANLLQITTAESRYLSWNGGEDGKGDRILGFLPFYHIYGLTAILHHALYVGWTLVVMAKFDIEKFCAHVQNYKITKTYVAPPVVLLLAKHPIVDKYDLSSLRMLTSGAAPLTEDIVNALYKRLKIPTKQAYGLSETSPWTHTQPWEDWSKTIGSIGHILANMSGKFMTTPSSDGADSHTSPTELPPGEIGEMYLKGPNIFLGYHKNPTATASSLTPDGWFRTGDVGYRDKDGNFYITDRVKELIKYKGSQVAPAELEGLLIANENVSDVAVVGVESKRLGTEVPRAYIVPTDQKNKTPADGEDIQNWLAKKVANHKRLRGGVKFVEEIPKSASGKILRRILKKRAEKEMVEEEGKEEGQLKAKL